MGPAVLKVAISDPNHIQIDMGAPGRIRQGLAIEAKNDGKSKNVKWDATAKKFVDRPTSGK
jgi:hypothetical protein